MFKKVKLLLASCVVAGVLGVLPVAAASAATSGWMVNTFLLSGSKGLAATAEVTEPIDIAFGSGLLFGIECLGSQLESQNLEITAPNKGAATSITFTGCRSQQKDARWRPPKLQRSRSRWKRY
jgi:hypothetical protein